MRRFRMGCMFPPSTIRWLSLTPLLVTMVIYFLLAPLPPELAEPWKARQVLVLLGAIRYTSILTEQLGVASRFTATRVIVDQLSRLPPRNYTHLVVEDAMFGGVKVRLYKPVHQTKPGPALIYFHGGGWLMGSVDSHDPITSYLARHLQVLVMSVEYRLSPDHPYPAPVDDCLTATLHLHQVAARYSVDVARIGLAGDSAGGNMVAAVSLRLRAWPGVTPPVLQVLLYPLLQALDFSLPSFMENDGLLIGSRREIAEVILTYGGHDRGLADVMLRHRHVSLQTRIKYNKLFNITSPQTAASQNSNPNPPQPTRPDNPNPNPNPRPPPGPDPNPRPPPGHTSLYELEALVTDPFFMPLMSCDLRDLPVTLVVTCQYDTLRDDGVIFTRRLHDAGVTVTHRNYNNSYHGMISFFNGPITIQDASHMMNDITAFIIDNL